ncbi:flagellar motor protein MotB [Paracoccaceae bacterium Fryx2]|nr:flagellar motor protein MotB [Paracoccaceae bacterium Fryx2]
MAGQSNAAPVIIKRKKIIQGGGHHGGAWKVAYADFVTAMMAFFMLMWLLNATTEKQRKGLADYFNPTIPVNRASGGGDGAFGGDSVFSEDTMAQNGTGASSQNPTPEREARGDIEKVAGTEGNAAEKQMREIEKVLTSHGGESMTMERALRHIITKVTDEGLVIEIFDLPDVPLFVGSTAEPTPILTDIAKVLAEVLALSTNGLAVNGHVRAYPIMLIDNPVWALSAARAQAMRDMVGAAGLPAPRVQRISGHADRKPVTADPMAVRNNRVEIVLLRRDR